MLIRKRIILVVWMVLCTINLCAQLPVYTCSFEDAAERDQWMLNMGRMRLLNMWYFGKAGNFDVNGTNGLYISRDDNGVDPVYNPINTMFVTATRQMPDMPSGNYRLYFDWKCGGKKTTSEGLYVCWVPLDTLTSSAANAGGLPLWVKDYQCGTVFSGNPQWSVGQVDVKHDGTPHKLVFVWFNTQGTMAAPAACVDNLELRPFSDDQGMSCHEPYDITHTLAKDTVLLEWKGNAQYYDIRCYDYLNDTWFVRNNLTETNCMLSGISEGVHSFIIRAHCSDTTASDYVQYTQLIYHKGVRCIDYLDLNGKCYTGAYATRKNNGNPNTSVYSRPFPNMEQVDYGYDDMRSRHTIHYMPDEYDANTNYQLPTVPDGYLASVRLGDAGYGGTLGAGNGLGESIEYKYKVEDGASSILKIWYAVVLSNPHPEEPVKNPQFWLDVLCEGKPIANDCGFAFFTAGDSQESGWLEGSDTSPSWLYKPWTEHAINLRDYVGKVLTIRLATTDCEPSGHTGYAYFVLDCEDAGLSGLNCGEDNPTTELEAPSGFDYVWYLPEKPLDTLCTEQLFRIEPMDTNIYCVNVINKNNANCWYTLTATGRPRIPTPLAIYSAVNKDCQNVVTFENYSCVSLRNQETNKMERTTEPVTSLTWDFGDGTIQSSSTYIGAEITHAYPPEGGRYEVQLSAGISGDACVVTKTIVLDLPDITKPSTEIVEHLCREDYPFGYRYADEWWKEDVDTTFTFVSLTSKCDSVCRLQLFFHDADTVLLTDTICQGDTLFFFGEMLKQSGQYVDTVANVYGCDSIVALSLYVEPMVQIYLQDSLTLCLDSKMLEFPHEVLQGNMDSIVVTFDSLACAAGFMPRYVFSATDRIEIAVPESVVPNFYTAVISYFNPYCGVTTDTVALELTYQSSIAIVKSNMLAVKNEDFNGGYNFDYIQWYRDGELIPGATGPNLAVGDGDRGHTFSVKLIRTGEAVAVGSCPILYMTSDVESMEFPMITWPAYVYNSVGTYLGRMSWDEFSNLPVGFYLLSDGKNTIKIIL